MIEFAEIPIGSGGVVGCALCRPASEPVAPRSVGEVSADLNAVVLNWPKDAAPNVIFGEFEPFMHPDLPEIIATAVGLGFERIRLTTDAGALARPGNAEGALAAGVRQIEVVLLAGTAEDHDRLSGRRGLFAAAAQGAASFLAAAESAGEPVVVTGVVPLCAHTQPGLPETVLAFARMGAVAVIIDARGARDVSSELIGAALDTATMNAMAGSVLGVEGLPQPCASLPWVVRGQA